MTGAKWLIARWRQTRHLTLSLVKETSSEVIDALLTAKQNANGLLQLDMLWNEISKGADASTAASELFSRLTAHAGGLCTLCLHTPSLSVLPPLPNLQHLVLETMQVDLAAIARNLPLLVALQTLCIICYTCEEGGHEAEIALGGLRNLHHVKLQHIVPSKLSLPQAAALHVVVHLEKSARHPVWRGVLPMLRTFRWTNDALDLVELPEVLKMPSGLTDVLLHMRDVGSSEQPLRLLEAFTPSTNVCFMCQDGWFDVWGGMWCHLCVKSMGSLAVSALHSSLPDSCLQKFKFEGELWPRGCALAGSIRQGLISKKCLEKRPRWHSLVSLRLRCTCRACRLCLERSGVIKRHTYR